MPNLTEKAQTLKDALAVLKVASRQVADVKKAYETEKVDGKVDEQVDRWIEDRLTELSAPGP